MRYTPQAIISLLANSRHLAPPDAGPLSELFRSTFYTLKFSFYLFLYELISILIYAHFILACHQLGLDKLLQHL